MVGIVWSYEGEWRDFSQKGHVWGWLKGLRKMLKSVKLTSIDLSTRRYHEKNPFQGVQVFVHHHMFANCSCWLADLFRPQKKILNDSKTTMNLQQLQLKIPQKTTSTSDPESPESLYPAVLNFTIFGGWTGANTWVLEPPFFDTPSFFKTIRFLARPGTQWWCRLAQTSNLTHLKQVFVGALKCRDAKMFRVKIDGKYEKTRPNL